MVRGRLVVRIGPKNALDPSCAERGELLVLGRRRGAKRAARELARLETATKNRALEAMANALELRSEEILEANARDMEAGEDAGLHSGLLDRLKLTEERLAGIANDVRSIIALPDRTAV